MITAALAPLARRETWFRVFTFSLFACSTFSITGVEISVMGLYLVAIYHWLRGGPREKLPRWIVAPMLLWVAVAVASALANPDPLGNLWDLRHLYRIFLPLALLPALQVTDFKRLLTVYLVFACLIAAYGYTQFYWGVDLFRPEGTQYGFHKYVTESGTSYFRAKGNFVGPGSFANHMMMIGLLFCSLFFSSRKKARYGWGLGALMAVGALAASMGRSAGLGMLFGLLVMTKRLSPRWSISIVSIAIAAFLTLAILVESGWVQRNFGQREYSFVLHRIISSSTDFSGSLIRVFLWKAGIRGILDHPVLGVGFENRERILPYIKAPPPWLKGFIPHRKKGADLHNIYLQVAFDLGLAGLLVYIWLWAAVFVWDSQWIVRAGTRFHFERGILWGTSSGLAASLVDGFFHDTFFSGNANATILMFMGLGLAAGCRIRAGLRETVEDGEN